jgi:hypothetical protein
MVLDPKQTTVAYRCPHCGTGVISAVNLFSLSADMVKLKCTCGKSEMKAVISADKRVRLTVPCMICAKPHSFTLNTTLFFDKDLFSMQCPYSDINIACVGETNQVKAELARGELELLDLMEKSGLQNFEDYHEEDENLSDPQVLDIVMFVINDMDAEGKIYCKCNPADNDRRYDAEVLSDCVCVSCRKCGASRKVPTDSRLGAHAFLHADALYLE